MITTEKEKSKMTLSFGGALVNLHELNFSSYADKRAYSNVRDEWRHFMSAAIFHVSVMRFC